MYVTDSIFYAGVYDKDLDLFEGQYPLKMGVTYNSYVVIDDKIAVMDTVDQRAEKEWLDNLEKILQGRTPDYLVVSHMEPDHGAGVQVLCEKYPGVKIVGNAKTFQMIDQFFEGKIQAERIAVKEGDQLSLGKHTLTFIMAPMVHWPEVMMSYETSEKILFSADAFGTFASEEDWVIEARRYYANIVGKFGMQVQNVLKKTAKLDIKKICPLHGPVLEESIEQCERYYQLWSSYMPEESGVLIACASIYGHTMAAAEYLKEQLEKAGETVIVQDLCRTDVSEAVANAFCYDRLILAASSYDGGVFPPMAEFLQHLQAKNFQKRTVGLIQNGSWAPTAAKAMQQTLESLKAMEILAPVVTIKGSLNEDSKAALRDLAEAVLDGGCKDETCG